MPEPIKKIRNRMLARKAHYDTYRMPKDKNLTLFIMPERGRYDTDDQIPDDGKDRFTELLDHTAGINAEDLAAALVDGLSPPDREWKKIELKDKDLMENAEVKQYLSLVNKKIDSHLHEVGAYNIFQDVYEELVVFGTGPMFIDSDPVDIASYHSFTAGEYYIAENSKGRVDYWARRYVDTVDNVIEKFGIDNVSERVKNMEDKEGYVNINLIHVVEVNRDRKKGKLDSKNKKYISTYFEASSSDDEKPLRQSGYDEFPLTVPRYRKVGSEVYGQSPSMRALGLAKMNNDMQEDVLAASEAMANPGLALDKRLDGQDVGPNSISYYDAAEGPALIQNVSNVQYDINSNLLVQEQNREAIRTILKSNLFNAISNIDRTNMTATEVAQRVAEAIKRLVSVVARLNSEFLRPMIERVYLLHLQAGAFPEPPEIIAGLDLEIVFISSLSQAQQAQGITSIEQIIDLVRRLAEIDPTILDKFNADEALDNVARMSGVEPDVVRTDEEVNTIRAERKADLERQQTAESLAQMADSAQKLGATPMNTGSALDTVVEGVQQGAEAAA